MNKLWIFDDVVRATPLVRSKATIGLRNADVSNNDYHEKESFAFHKELTVRTFSSDVDLP